jgi:hypothetical protein
MLQNPNTSHARQHPTAASRGGQDAISMTQSPFGGRSFDGLMEKTTIIEALY